MGTKGRTRRKKENSKKGTSKKRPRRVNQRGLCQATKKTTKKKQGKGNNRPQGRGTNDEYRQKRKGRGLSGGGGEGVPKTQGERGGAQKLRIVRAARGAGEGGDLDAKKGNKRSQKGKQKKTLQGNVMKQKERTQRKGHGGGRKKKPRKGKLWENGRAGRYGRQRRRGGQLFQLGKGKGKKNLILFKRPSAGGKQGGVCLPAGQGKPQRVGIREVKKTRERTFQGKR